jgi:hypothetical protein
MRGGSDGTRGASPGRPPTGAVRSPAGLRIRGPQPAALAQPQPAALAQHAPATRGRRWAAPRAPRSPRTRGTQWSASSVAAAPPAGRRGAGAERAEGDSPALAGRTPAGGPRGPARAFGVRAPSLVQNFGSHHPPAAKGRLPGPRPSGPASRRHAPTPRKVRRGRAPRPRGSGAAERSGHWLPPTRTMNSVRLPARPAAPNSGAAPLSSFSRGGGCVSLLLPPCTPSPWQPFAPAPWS